MSNRFKIVLALFLLAGVSVVGFFSYNRTAQTSAPASSANKQALDAALFITPAQVRQQQESPTPQEVMLIDSRRPEEFKKIRIPGSLNIPLFALPHKDFLKQKSCVLVNEGYGYRPLLEACRELKQAGFVSVRILQGGLNSWQLSGGPLDSQSGAIAELRAIPPQQLFQDREYAGIAVINIKANKASPAAAAVLPGAVDIEADVDIPDLLKTIIKTARSCAGPEPLYVVIAGDDPALIVKLQQRSAAELPFVTWYLDGGMKSYADYLHMQKLAQKPVKMKTPGSRCATCG